MSAEPAAAQSDWPSTARRGREPRSTLWRVALGTTPVVATALTLEFGRTLVVDSFGETEVVATLASTLRAFWILLVVAGVLFAGYRWYSQRQDAERHEHTRALLDALDEPDVAVIDLPARPAPARPEPDAALRDPAAAVLRELPSLRYDITTLLAVAAALVDNAESLAAPSAPPSTLRTATGLRDHWVRAGVLTAPDALRYDLARVPRTPPRAEVLKMPAWAAALYALVRAHADRATARATALGHLEHAAAARRWFDATAPDLRVLVAECAGPLRHQLPVPVLPELVRILDALEVWQVGDSALAELSRRMETIPRMAKFPHQRAVLRLRANPIADERTHYRPLRRSTGVAARSKHSRALDCFRIGAAPDYVAAELEDTWRLLPHADLQAQVCVLINLAVAELRRGELDAAGDRLDLALVRTENGRDPGGRVHATEILGILHWMRGESVAALNAWRTAWTGYRALADRRGEGRCLRHLGSALRADPALGGVAVAPEPGQPLHRDRVWRQANGWITAADFLDPDNRAAPPTLMGPPAPPMDRPPLELPDEHLRIARRPDSG